MEQARLIELYLVGALVAFGYQLAAGDFQLYDLIVCPLIWPLALVMQLVLFAFMWLDAVEN